MEGNLCPECGGIGYIEGECTFWGGQYEPPEYADVPCPVCAGEGVVTTPLTEEDAATTSYMQLGGMLAAERDPRTGRDCATLNERL